MRLSALLRAALLPVAGVYSIAIGLRNARYDRAATVRAGVPVISVGNITAGGTGKTPFVIHICQRLREMARSPVILTRGYRAPRGGEADEVLEFRAALPDVPVVVDADRVRGAERAIREHAADCLVLDDAFQHRRLARDLDVVLIDALDPWGGGHLLPAGRLREPLRNLRRAHLLVITRVNQVDAAHVRELERRLADFAPGVAAIRAAVIAEAALPAGPILGVCGLGNPESFRRSLAEIAPTAGLLTFRDHHAYGDADVRRIQQRAREAGAAAVLAPRKDWVKLAPLWPTRAEIELVRLNMRLAPEDDTHGLLETALRSTVRIPMPPPAPLRSAR